MTGSARTPSASSSSPVRRWRALRVTAVALALAAGSVGVATELASQIKSPADASHPASATLPAAPAAEPTAASTAPASAPAIAQATPGMANAWHTLTPRQQNILYPLRPEWNKLSDLNRSKWLKIAERYPKLKKDQQQRLQERMRDWVALTPQQRRIARENYQISKQLSAEKKAEAWQDYQQLSDEQKRKLAAASRATKPSTAVSALPSSGGLVKDVRPPHRPASQIDIDELLHSE
ncbi:DUF3106 domain-containing protein [Imbroritus primus]|uniref:DUF3106 domain-containing protein n=1 Tax=Imbroritus primus TaxID=3058603 RepID=UPI003D161163